MATKNYMINDKWLDLDKRNIIELQSVDGELDSLKVNGYEIVEPSGKITITENGTDINIAQYAKADVNVEGGGGNPNTKQTVTGTLADPWGNIDLNTLATALTNQEATAYLDINASALGVGIISSKPSVNTETHNIYITGSTIEGDNVSAYNITWDASGTLIVANMYMGGNVTSILSYKDNITTSLTVVWHPLS